MNKILQAIGHFVKHAAVVVSDKFIEFFGTDVAHTFAVGAEGLIHTAIGQIAMTAVQEVESLAAGADKRAAAFDKIKTVALAAGYVVGESVINMLIEICVQKVKGQFGPAKA